MFRQLGSNFPVKTAQLSHLAQPEQFSRGQALRVCIPALWWRRGSSTHARSGFGLVPSLLIPKQLHTCPGNSWHGRESWNLLGTGWGHPVCPFCLKGLCPCSSAHNPGILWALSCCGPIKPECKGEAIMAPGWVVDAGFDS